MRHCPLPTPLHSRGPCVWCAAGRGDSGGNFTDYIEFQHSDDSGAESEELLHHANGNSSSRPPSLPTAEDWTWGRLLKDIWKVRHMTHQPRVGSHHHTSIYRVMLQTHQHEQQCKGRVIQSHPQPCKVVCCNHSFHLLLHQQQYQQQQQGVGFATVSLWGCAAVALASSAAAGGVLAPHKTHQWGHVLPTPQQQQQGYSFPLLLPDTAQCIVIICPSWAAMASLHTYSSDPPRHQQQLTVHVCAACHLRPQPGTDAESARVNHAFTAEGEEGQGAGGGAEFYLNSDAQQQAEAGRGLW